MKGRSETMSRGDSGKRRATGALRRSLGSPTLFLSRAIGSAATVASVAVSAAAAPAFAAQGCPNEALRGGLSANLPDCRAYEMVTPPYKEGYRAGSLFISPDGSHAIFRTTGIFAGAKNGGEVGPPYEVARGGSGWTTSALEPPITRFAAARKYDDASVDLQRTLWELHTPEQSVYTHDYFIRGPDGAFALVGPAFAESVEAGPRGSTLIDPGAGSPFYAGASADLGKVLFSIAANPTLKEARNPLWPGDATALVGETYPSLYEYAGTGNTEPELVGVENRGPLAGSPHRNEGAKLISKCGTQLGSSGGREEYNAVSASGATVFFTAMGKENESCERVEGPRRELRHRRGAGRGPELPRWTSRRAAQIPGDGKLRQRRQRLEASWLSK